jgi:hypothetical protein
VPVPLGSAGRLVGGMSNVKFEASPLARTATGGQANAAAFTSLLTALIGVIMGTAGAFARRHWTCSLTLQR